MGDLNYSAVVDKRVVQELVVVLGEDALTMKLDPPQHETTCDIHP